jgi:glycosyltransferase involved in cell wall biosynthesis
MRQQPVECPRAGSPGAAARRETGAAREAAPNRPRLGAGVHDGSVGLVHDYLLVLRGAERAFAAMADEWPHAPVHTTLYDPAGTRGRFAGRDVRTSPLQRLRLRQRGFRRALPLYPWAVERLDVAGHDVVVSSSSAFAHGVRPRAGAVRVCYCHSPFRYAHHERATALAELPRAARPLLGAALDRIRAWDADAARRVDRYVANSTVTRERIRRLYGRDAPVVHPPVDVERFAPGVPEDHVVVVGELVAHKRVGVILEAARRAGTAVVVIGEGPERRRLEAAHPHARFLGRVPDERLAAELARAKALVCATVEEFGISAVEAQAAGRPVVAPRAGGTGETVVDGLTGVLLDAVDAGTLAEALRHTDFDRFDPALARANAERFSTETFRARLRAEVERARGRLRGGAQPAAAPAREAAPGAVAQRELVGARVALGARPQPEAVQHA